MPNLTLMTCLTNTLSRFPRTPSQIHCLYALRCLHTQHTPRSSSIPYFDAHRFCSKLEQEGFSPQQARAVIRSLDDVINESLVNATSILVNRTDQEKANFSKLRTEIQGMEKREVEEAKMANERLKSDLDKLRKLLQEEITRSQAGVRLDLSLEKGRIRDEMTGQHEKLRSTDEKIEGEVLELKRHMEAIKLHILQYMIGTITGAGTLNTNSNNNNNKCH
ncbi:hypothetical protein BDF14DRAFT_1884716 [Spinellus fusiger]|nr:hypothetical protein BDF14DRAFT_1884716 [Spinellus fusiger]